MIFILGLITGILISVLILGIEIYFLRRNKGLVQTIEKTIEPGAGIIKLKSEKQKAIDTLIKEKKPFTFFDTL